MKTISSRQNPIVQRIRDAIRNHADEIAIEGPKQVSDAIASGWSPLLLATSGEYELPLRSGAAEEVSLSEKLFASISATESPQGVVALFERPKSDAARILSQRSGIAVALDGVQDPGNVGTIVRLAAAFDATGVLLLPGCADAFSPKALRASVGAALQVSIATTTAEQIVDSGTPLFAADGAGECIDPPASGAVLVFGNEGTGLSGVIMRTARRIAIPTSARVESLNVAASAAILLARAYALRLAG